jgi:hypothetical protein
MMLTVLPQTVTGPSSKTAKKKEKKKEKQTDPRLLSLRAVSTVKFTMLEVLG